ncbi:MAG: phosphoribosyltransferase family protein [Conexivisphaera sp.]
MGGILGVRAFGQGMDKWRVSPFMRYGLMGLQHRGYQGAHMAAYDGSAIGTASADDADGLDVDLPGHAGVGAVISGRDSWFGLESGIAVAGDGAPDVGWAQFVASLRVALSSGDPAGAVSELVERTGGFYSFVALSGDGLMVAARDVRGSLPLEVGSMGFDMGAVASESSALEVMGFDHVGPLRPGEVLLMGPIEVERRNVPRGDPLRCSFEYVYMARHDSVIDGIPVYAVRERIGELLAEEAPADADVVIGVPETSLPVAAGYSRRSGIPLAFGFVSSVGRVRTAGLQSALERIVGVQLKLNVIGSSVDGRDVVLVDDSVVRGTTLRNVVWNMRRKGARRIHVRIGSPPLAGGCPLGRVPQRDELISSDISEDVIASVIGADSVRFLSSDGLHRAVGADGLCAACWMGGVTH